MGRKVGVAFVILGALALALALAYYVKAAHELRESAFEEFRKRTSAQTFMGNNIVVVPRLESAKGYDDIVEFQYKGAVRELHGTHKFDVVDSFNKKYDECFENKYTGTLAISAVLDEMNAVMPLRVYPSHYKNALSARKWALVTGAIGVLVLGIGVLFVTGQVEISFGARVPKRVSARANSSSRPRL